jgi:hypothetical protein
MTARKSLSLSSTAVLFLVYLAGSECQVTSFTPGQVIHDTDGKPIKAFAGGISYFNGIYYWYGEFKNGDFPTAEVPCYTSTDLLNWKYQGNMVPGLHQGELAPFVSLERPHVIYNDMTKKYVMWMHLENKEYNYGLTGVFVSASPTGHFYSAASSMIAARMAAVPTTTTTAINPSSRTMMERPIISFLLIKTMAW